MIGKIEDAITTSEAAAILGLSIRRVRHLAALGRLRHDWFGRMLVLSRADVVQFGKIPRPPGNPNWRKKKE